MSWCLRRNAPVVKIGLSVCNPEPLREIDKADGVRDAFKLLQGIIQGMAPEHKGSKRCQTLNACKHTKDIGEAWL